jgi:hypothetical protein
MKNFKISRPALILLVIGLLLTSLIPIVNRYFPMPDGLTGFLMGLGLAIEVIGLIKMDRLKKKSTCA